MSAGPSDLLAGQGGANSDLGPSNSSGLSATSSLGSSAAPAAASEPVDAAAAAPAAPAPEAAPAAPAAPAPAAGPALRIKKVNATAVGAVTAGAATLMGLGMWLLLSVMRGLARNGMPLSGWSTR